MKIVIAGGAGAMALSAILYCLEQSDVREVIVADLDESKVKDRITQLNDRRVKGEVLDLKDTKASAKVFKGARAVLNTALKDSCLPAMEAALEAGTHYTDISGPPEERLILDQPFKEKGLTAVVCLGTAPGMSNIMAAYAVGKLDRVHSIEMKDVCANLVPHRDHSRALYWGFAIESILREFSTDAQVMENGEIKLYPPLAQPEIVAFRPPVGPAQVAVTAHPEIAMFARSFKDKGLKNATWKIGFEPEFEAKMSFLCALGFHKEEPISVDGAKVSPRSVLLTLLKNQPPETKQPPDFRGHMIVVVKGEEKGQEVEYTLTEYATAVLTERMQKRGVFSSYRTGIYAAIATMMVARGQVEKKGVLYPETSIPAAQFLKEVVRYGIEVEVIKRIAVGV